MAMPPRYVQVAVLVEWIRQDVIIVDADQFLVRLVWCTPTVISLDIEDGRFDRSVTTCLLVCFTLD